MIRINLLPTKRKKKAKPMPLYLVGAGVALGLSLMCLLFVKSYMDSRINALNEDKAKKNAELTRLKALTKHVTDFEDKKKKLKTRIDIILKLAKKKALPAKFLDEIALRLTKGIWIKSIKITRDKVNIAGVGFNNADIVTYVEHMKDTGKEPYYIDSPVYFKDVRLHGTQKVQFMGQTVYNFTLSCLLKDRDEGKAGGGNGS